MAKKDAYWQTHNSIVLDKYYTPVNVAEHLIQTTNDVLKLNEKLVTEIIEPAAGAGAFSLFLPRCLAYDIAPEHESIIKQDFLALDLPYKEGRMFIGNPPFGMSSQLLKKFIAKCSKAGDYMAFICSSGYYKKPLDGFDLLYSEYLHIEYSGCKVKTCFNVYARSTNVYEYKFVDEFTIVERVKNKTKAKIWYDDKAYGLNKNPALLHNDLMICRFGGGLGMYTKDINRWCSIGVVKFKEGVNVEYIKQLIDFGKDEFKHYRQLSRHTFDFVLKNIEEKYDKHINNALIPLFIYILKVGAIGERQECIAANVN
jgi:hypothetical protein